MNLTCYLSLTRCSAQMLDYKVENELKDLAKRGNPQNQIL